MAFYFLKKSSTLSLQASCVISTIWLKAFDLILTFDDVITQGYRESVTMPQLEAFLEMDSTDEKIFRK